jgi:hypothetical protein
MHSLLLESGADDAAIRQVQRSKRRERHRLLSNCSRLRQLLQLKIMDLNTIV